MRRREFITLLGGAAAAWPLAAWAQQPGSPIVGFMSARGPEDSGYLVDAFRAGLAEGGFIEGQNVAIEYRWARGQYDRLPALAADLVRRRVNVLVAIGGDPSPIAAKQATSSIPIVFGMGGDPIKAGLVQSFNRPGGNVTGVSILTNQLEAKRFGLLRELVPGLPLMGVLINKDFRPSAVQLEEVENAARTVNQRIVVATARCWWPLLLISIPGATASSISQRTSDCPPSTNFANMPRRAACSAMVSASLTVIGSLGPTRRAFSTVPIPQPCPFNNPSSSNWCSTSRPQERSN